MKNLKKTLIVLVSILLFSAAWANGRGKGGARGMRRGSLDFSYMELTELTSEQKEDLAYMWQEEKLARDVYKTFAQNYSDSKIFSRIAQAEARHMKAIASLMQRHGLVLPANDLRGEFQDENFKRLYQEMVIAGARSFIDAINVGLKIEKLDIADLEEKMQGNIPRDMELTFNKLLRASYKHKAAFTRNL